MLGISRPQKSMRGSRRARTPTAVAIVFLVSAFPSPGRERAGSINQQLRGLLPQANVIKVFYGGVTAPSESSNGTGDPESTVNSIGQAIEICMSWREALIKRHPSSGHQQAVVALL